MENNSNEDELRAALAAALDGIDEIMGRLAKDAPHLLPKNISNEPWKTILRSRKLTQNRTFEPINPLRETATSCGPVLRGEVVIRGERYSIECDKEKSWLNIIDDNGSCESCVIEDENQLFSESGAMLSEDWDDSDWSELAKFVGIESEVGEGNRQ